MWPYSNTGIKIIHEQMIQEVLEQRAFSRSEKHARRSSLKHLFRAAQAHFTTPACQPQAVLPRCDREGFCSES
jgi:hypothetical protein